MKCRLLALLLFCIFLSGNVLAQKRIPPPPPPPPPPNYKKAAKPVIARPLPVIVSTELITTNPEKKTSQAKTLSKIWIQVFKNKVFANTDSALFVYQATLEKKKNIQKKMEEEIRTLSLVKSAFETTSEFETRKQSTLKVLNEKYKEISNVIDQTLSEFQDAVYVSRTNKFKIDITDKEYNADKGQWSFKILDVQTGNINNVTMKIEPSDAQKLWNKKDEIKLQQVVDFSNPSSMLAWLYYPDELSYDPLVFEFVNKKNVKEVNKEEIDEEALVNDVELKQVGEAEASKIENLNDNVEREASKESSTVEESDKIFTSVQIPSTFPGGAQAWVDYLTRNLDRDTIVTRGAPAGRYAVTVSFIVARDGTISNVKAENDPGYGSAQEAVRVIQKGPKWIPAEQNGHKVIYRHRQAIVFQVTED
jgi:hypothetical protein